ncbi:hypothetical protein Patl1_37209 [Pistacia atlantica]|nr:hypothetical protein Patl1_37209 [Pistacia atlantica]
MELLTSTSAGVIVVVDANRNKKNVDALDWVINHFVRPRDKLLLLGVLQDFGKKNYSCFPLISNVGISGIWEKLEFSSGHGEVNPRELGAKLERKRVQYQNNLEKFHRQCRRKEVKLEVKLAAGYCPGKITVDEAQNSNTRWIVLDSHFEKYQGFIRGHVGCNVAIMKGKDFATLMPSKFPLITTLAYPPNYYEGTNQEVATNDQPGSHDKNPEQEPNSSAQQPAATPHWYPLSWRSGFPRAFSLREVEEITDGFGEENLLKKSENLNVYEGIFQETPVVIKSFQEDDDRFWTVLMIPFQGSPSQHYEPYDELARKLTWKARWYIAVEIGGSLRYLHEECGDGPIVHQSVCSGHIVFSHGCSAMLCNFLAAKWLNLQESPAETENSEQDEKLYIDVRDYGMFLLELITGQNAEENKGQSLLDWVLAVVRGDRLAISNIRSNGVYLVDFTCYTPGDHLQTPIVEHLEVSNIFYRESLDFQEKVLERAGVGDEAFMPLPTALHEILPGVTLKLSREETEEVLFTVMKDLLSRHKINLKSIDILVSNCSLFCPTPISSMIINNFGLRSNIKNFSLSGMGCSAGMLSISLVKDLLKVHTNSLALVLSIEAVTPDGYRGCTKSMLIANTVFRMRGAAILLSNRHKDKHIAKYKLQHLI